MKMSRLTPRLQAIQKKYANDQQKQSEMIQALYKEEGVSMGGGCLWSFVPLLILLPLYTVVREPITYILHESADVAAKIVEVLKQEHEIVKAGEPLLKIIDDSFLFAVVNFPLKKVKPTGAVLKLKLENDTIVNGKIYEISPQVNHRTGTLRLRILIDNAAGTLRAGMTGEVINAE